MSTFDVAHQRLRNSGLTGEPFGGAVSVVRWLCAVQAQDYAGARWAIAQRTGGATAADIDRLFNEGAILRTHVLRPTWHFVLPADIRWLLQLTGPRVAAAAAYYDRALGLDSTVFARSNTALGRALQGEVMLTRKEIGERLRRSGIDADNQRLGHLLMHAELDGVVCSGGLRGRQLTYALLDERAPATRAVDPDAALGELATRYFASHGPAQLRDFAWWSGLTIGQARSGAEMAWPRLDSTTLDGTTYFFAETSAPPRVRRPMVHLLPNWDEYLVGYADRTAHYDGAVFATPPTSLELLASSVVVDGRLVGGWRRAIRGDEVTVTAILKIALTTAQRAALERTCKRYSRFLARPVQLVTEGPATL